jgi:Glycosyltransferase family 25 (LPS biosynthesis protein)
LTKCCIQNYDYRVCGSRFFTNQMTKIANDCLDDETLLDAGRKSEMPSANRLVTLTSHELKYYFDQVWVINLKRREDRLERFWNEINKSRWPFRRPQVFSAIEGDKVGVPKYWQTGGGSYGCLRSHMALLERAIQDDIGSILVLEDDAVFMNTFGKEAVGFLTKVPDDWQCLMLGGQHVNSTPFPVAPGIVRAGAGGGIQRTHCYALRGHEIMRALYITWANAAVHCDWVMGPCTAKFSTYAPDPFLVGQAEGSSDISGQHNPPKFWRTPVGTEPVIVLRAPRLVMEALRNKGWHTGFNRDPATGIDVGLCEIFDDTTLGLPQRSSRIDHWIEMIQWEVVSMAEPAICTIWHPAVETSMVESLVKGRVIEITANTEEEALNQLPADIHVHNRLRSREPASTIGSNIRVVLLRASRVVMEILREEGWHSGNWRDEVTGQDNGVRRLFASVLDKAGRSAGLQDIVRTLHEEVRQKTSGIVTLWHDEISPDMLVTDDIQVFEIIAANAHEAKLKLEEMTNGRQS